MCETLAIRQEEAEEMGSGGHDNSTFGSCSSSLALHTDDAMSASFRMAQEVDEAKSESSWTALAKGRKETVGALTWRVKWRSWR